jgi:hypothetical protein
MIDYQNVYSVTHRIKATTGGALKAEREEWVIAEDIAAAIDILRGYYEQPTVREILAGVTKVELLDTALVDLFDLAEEETND